MKQEHHNHIIVCTPTPVVNQCTTSPQNAQRFYIRTTISLLVIPKLVLLFPSAVRIPESGTAIMTVAKGISEPPGASEAQPPGRL